MSKEIDQRVVELQFDNANFERNAKESISTLDKLKEKLNFKRTGEGLKELEDRVAKFTMKPLEDAVEGVRVKFTLLDNFVWNFFDRISNKILDVGKNLVSAFTIDPIKTGFQEYETQINAVQTILANTQSKGSTLDDVNEALDKLNKYADLTIYNFTEMTRNIGTFTAAGVGLQDATDAIQGIANLAAVSGSTSQQASTAMYQLSQALSAGSLKLQDWNSVVNAGMGGEVFQNALKQTAREYGIAVDSIIEKAGTFRESLKDGWITSEVLTTTLKKMTVTGADEYLAKLTGISQQHIAAMHEEAASSADMEKGFRDLARELAATGKVTEEQAYQLLNMSTTAQDAATKVKTFSQLMDTLKEAAQSGWTQTWELIVGDFGEAKELFTFLSDAFSGLINESSDARNAIVADALGSDWEKLTKVLTDAGVSIDTFKDTLIKNAKESGVAIDEWIAADGSFENTLQRGWLKDSDITKAFEDLAKGTSGATVALEDYQKAVTDVVMGKYGNGAKRVEALTAANLDYAEVQALVNKCWDGQVLHLDRLDTAQLKNIGMTEEQINTYKKLAEESKDPASALNQMIQDMSAPSGRTLLVDSLKNTLSGILTIVKSIRKAFNQVFKPSAGPIKKFLKIINDLSKKFVSIEKYADQLTRTFSGLFSILGIIGDIISGTLSFAFTTLNDVLHVDAKSVLDFTANIGDNIVAFRQWMKDSNAIQNGLAKLKTIIVSVVDNVKEFVAGFKESDVIATGVERIQNAFAALKSGAGINLDSLGESFTSFIQKIKNGDKIDFSNVSGSLSTLSEDVDAELAQINLSFSGFAEYVKADIPKRFQNAFSGIVGVFEGFRTELGHWIYAIQQTFGNLNWGVVLSLFNAGFLLKMTSTITTQLGKLVDKFEPVRGILNSVKGAINQFSNMLKAEALKTKAEALLEIAAAVGILALSMTLLATIKDDDIKSVLINLAIALGTIAAMATVVALIGKMSPSFAGAFMSLLGLSIALAAVIKMITDLSVKLDEFDISAGRFIKTAGLVGGIMLALAASVAIMGIEIRAGGLTITNNLKGVAAYMITFAAGLYAFAAAMERLSKVRDVMDPKVAVQFVGLMGAMVLMLKLLSGPANMYVDKAGIALLAVSGAMLILFKLLHDMPTAMETTDWLKSLLSIAALTGVMFVILKALGGRISKYAAKAGLGLLGFSAALALLPISIKLLGSISKKDLNKGLWAVGVIGIVFAGLIAASKLAGEFAAKAGVTLLAAAGAMLAMTAVIAALGYLPEDKMWQGVKAVGAIGILFAVLEGLSYLAKDAKNSIIAIGGVFAVMATSLAILSSDLIDTNKLIAATDGLKTLMFSFTVLYGVIAASHGIRRRALPGIWNMVGVVAALSVLVGAISAIPAINDTVSLIVSISGIAALIMALSHAMVTISKTAPLATGAIPQIWIMVGVVAALGALVVGISALETTFGLSTSIETVGSLSILIMALSGAMVLVSLASKLAGGAGGVAAGLAAFGTFIAGMVAVTTILGTLQAFIDEYGGLQVFQKSIDVLGYIGEALGTLISSFGVGLVSGLPTIGNTLSQFMTNVQGFLTGLDGFDDESANTVANLVSILGQLFAGKFKIKDAEKNAEMYARLTANMEALMPSLIAFADNCKDINTEGLDAGCKAIEALVETSTKIPNSGGLFGNLVGENDWATFGTGLADLGSAIKSFSESCAGIDEDGLEAGCAATIALAEASDEIPNSGGLLADWIGDNTWGTMTTGLEDYGKALTAFSKAVAGVKKENVSQGAWATRELATAMDGIPNSGGWLADFLGDNNWVTFSDGLGPYGAALRRFSIYASDVSVDAVTNGKDATVLLGDAYSVVQGIPTSGYWKQIYDGLGEYGRILKWFSDDVEDIDPDRLLKITTATTNLASSMIKIKEGKLDKNDIKWDKVAGNIQEFRNILGSDVNLLAQTVNDTTTSGILKIKSYMFEIKEAFKAITGISESDIQAYSDRITLLLDSVKSARDTSNTISRGTLLENFKNVGKDMFDGIAEGIKDDSVIKSVVQTTADSILSNFRKYLGIPTNSETGASTGSFKMKVYGKQMVTGFIAGIDENTKIGSDAMTLFAQKMLKAFSTAAGISEANNAGKAVGEAYIDGVATVTTSTAKSGGMTGEVEGILTADGKTADTAAKAGMDTAQNWFGSTIDTIKTGAAGAKDKIAGWINGIFNGGSQGIIDSLGIDINSLLLGDASINDSDLSKYWNDLNKDFDGYSFDSKLQQAKDEFDALLDSYKQGKIDQAEYDRQYTALLKKYTSEQVGLIAYAQGQMKEYVEDTFKDINSDFEKQISDIQKKMDDLANNVTKPMEEAFTVKTNKDVYDEKMQEYQNRIDELTAKKDELIKQYGEEHMWVKQAERDIESATKKMNEYKKSYEDSSQEAYDAKMAEYAANLEKLEKKKSRVIKRYGEESQAAHQVEKQIQKVNAEMEKYQKTHKVINDEDIASVDYAETFKKETVALTNYNQTIKKLQARKVDDSILQMLAGETDIKKAAGIADYLNSLSDAELKAISDQYSIYQAAGKDLAQTIYGPEMENAVLNYTNSIISTMNTLPESAKAIGVNMVAGLASGFSSETEASLAQIGTSGQSITDELKRIYDIHSPSRVMREEIGYNLADGLIQGFLDRLKMWTNGLNAKVMSDLGISADDSMIDVESFNTVLADLTTAIQNRLDAQPTITPVLDLTQFDAGIAQMQTKINMQTPTYLVNSAMTVNSSDASVVAAINGLGTTLSNKLDSINPINAIGTLDANVTTGISNLGNTISGMTVVLDTGTLVGEISADLGMASTMKGRGT